MSAFMSARRVPFPGGRKEMSRIVCHPRSASKRRSAPPAGDGVCRLPCPAAMRRDVRHRKICELPCMSIPERTSAARRAQYARMDQRLPGFRALHYHLCYHHLPTTTGRSV